ncbi:histidine kinase [Pseudomonas sp. NPDC098747]|uniref:histidine kinase n=1 Tax=Pseudomonas sp. NPDC098747 TaxID=3364487 RepID=UPI00383B59D8
MPNKELRIIIADAHLSRRIQIEKSLNRLGYYRILPVECCTELASLSDAFQITFDVLIANRDLIREADNNLTATCQILENIDHTLLYSSQQSPLIMTSPLSTKIHLTQITTVPDDELIADFMARIDPPSPWKCLKKVAWLKNTYAINSQSLANN